MIQMLAGRFGQIETTVSVICTRDRPNASGNRNGSPLTMQLGHPYAWREQHTTSWTKNQLSNVTLFKRKDVRAIAPMPSADSAT